MKLSCFKLPGSSRERVVVFEGGEVWGEEKLCGVSVWEARSKFVGMDPGVRKFFVKKGWISV